MDQGETIKRGLLLYKSVRLLSSVLKVSAESKSVDRIREMVAGLADIGSIQKTLR